MKLHSISTAARKYESLIRHRRSKPTITPFDEPSERRQDFIGQRGMGVRRRAIGGGDNCQPTSPAEVSLPNLPGHFAYLACSTCDVAGAAFNSPAYCRLYDHPFDRGTPSQPSGYQDQRAMPMDNIDARRSTCICTRDDVVGTIDDDVA